MEYISGGVTAPEGFQAIGIAAGIKKQDRKDMAMLFSKVPANAAGTFTTNVVKAAPVVWDRRIVQENKQAQAVVVNSGIANACTGKEGMDYCAQTAQAAGAALGIEPELVFCASTGVIGAQLPIDRICSGVRTMTPLLSDSEEAGTLAAEAIMTTDTRKKETAVRFTLGGKTVTIGGMSKGSGMIHPNMCTMLAFLTTDCAISQEMLQKALSEDIKSTYNMISVDGDTSTNDTCILMANGLAGNEMITAPGEDFDIFCAALNMVNTWLAKHMAADGEGASCLFEVIVEQAESHAQAVTLAKSVVTSNLVKTAIAGHDANWGRILCAMGYSGAEFDPEKVDLFFESANGTLQIISEGVAADYDEGEATHILSAEAVTARICMHAGEETATAWGCDLTHEYISINADYRS